MRALKVKRVSYGKADTPVELREYKADFTSAVGNTNDWKDYGRQNAYEAVEFVEKDGTVRKELTY